uniref:Uncharacterized protein n=1 Tax=Plectus sambesii TaxID=2011161 RepID=A0A914UHV7_9BILA
MSNKADRSFAVPTSVAGQPSPRTPRIPQRLATATAAGSLPRQRNDHRSDRSIPPHPLLASTTHDFLSNLPKEDINILLNPIRHGNLDFNTELKLKRPGDRNTVNITAGQLIAAVGSQEDQDIYYDSIVAQPIYDEVHFERTAANVEAVTKPIHQNVPVTNENKVKQWIFAHRGRISVFVMIVLSAVIVLLAVLLGTHSCPSCKCTIIMTTSSMPIAS